MRVFLGLAALAASASTVLGQATVTPNSGNGRIATTAVPGQTALASVFLFANSAVGSAIPTSSITPASTATNPGINSGSLLTTASFGIQIPNSISAVYFSIAPNQYTAQIQYRWAPNYALGSAYTCDPCAGGTSTSCNSIGPGSGNSPAAGFPCASFTRAYSFTGLVVGSNSLSVQLLNSVNSQTAFSDTSSYSFVITRSAPAVIVGDPQIVGMQGQDFQVHGVPDEIFNIVSYPTLQINARFTYLESGACHDNFTACFAHPGTYISEEGIRIGKDKVRVSAGSFKKGLTVHVNGKKIKSNTDLKNGAVEMVSHRRVVVHTDVMRVAISNSDNFMNQELELMDDKLVSLGSKRVTLKDNEKFHSEVPLHGLQGQTWRNVEYPSGLEYEGSIMDYHVVDGNLFGTDFVFNQFQS